jgi:arsenate reductase-like glutaredoxin family protein
MDYLKQFGLMHHIQKYYANEITLEELKKVLHFIMDDIIIPDVVYTKKLIDKGE